MAGGKAGTARANPTGGSLAPGMVTGGAAGTGRDGTPMTGGNAAVANENPTGGSLAPGNGNRGAAGTGRLGSPIAGGNAGTANPKPAGGSLHRVATDHFQGTGGPPTEGVAVPVTNHA